MYVIKRLMLLASLIVLLVACGGNYTGTQSLDSLGTATPGAVNTAVPANPGLGGGGSFSTRVPDTQGVTEVPPTGAEVAGATTTSLAPPNAAARTVEADTTTETAATVGTTDTAATGVATSEAATDTAPTTAATSEGATAGATGPLPNLEGRAVLIGSDTTYPPMEYIDPQTNQIAGFDPDLMAEIAKLINIRPEFQTYPSFDTIFTALAAKQFDAVMSSVTITEERRQTVDFSDPYVSVGQQVVAGQNTTLQSYTDLKNGNLQVGVQRGTTGEQAALEEAGVADANVRRYDTIDAAFADLANNAIDAIIADGPTVANYASQPQYKDTLVLVGTPFTTEDYGIAFQKGDDELRNAVNGALALLKQNGKIDELKAKYNLK